MGKSRTVTVTVSRTSTELTIGLDRYDGTPGVINVLGSLYVAGTTNVLRGKTIQLLVAGSPLATTTTDLSGRYKFTFSVSAQRYSFQAKFAGDASYEADWSPVVVGEYGKIGTDLTIDVNPMFGDAPLAVAITGRLSRDDTGGGLGGKLIELHRNGVKIKTATTKTSTPLGIYQFNDTISANADYYVYFSGDTQFEGCEASDGAAVPDGEPPDEEPPEDKGLGAGAVLLALLVLSQE